MLNIFEIADKTGRKIRLTQERWSHITQEHPEVVSLEEVKDTLTSPLKIKSSKYSPEDVNYYYRFDKDKKKYLMVAVKYLNGDGFVITVYYLRNLK